jgi:8-oxo-dGTP diphosphatase
VRIRAQAFAIVKEVARHLLRRPVVGVVAAARTQDGRWLLVRRGDTGDWALPGGTLEWGERLGPAIRRELGEEAGVEVLELGSLAGVYSDPELDARFHAVTVVLHALVSEPKAPPMNPLEVTEVRLFADAELPEVLSFGMRRMLDDARQSSPVWD